MTVRIGPHGGWNPKRSMSIPQISPQDLKQFQPNKQLHASTLSKGSPHSHIMRTNFTEKQESSLLSTFMSGCNMSSKNQSTDQDTPPPLPPNHPSPIKKCTSQPAMTVTSPENIPSAVKKPNKAKHSQSVSSADRQVRISPREEPLETRAKNELAEVMARINRKIETEDTETKPTEPVKKREVKEGIIRSQIVVTEDFKKQLEGLVGHPNPLSLRSQIHNIPTDPSEEYESISHYLNANEIQNAKK